MQRCCIVDGTYAVYEMAIWTVPEGSGKGKSGGGSDRNPTKSDPKIDENPSKKGVKQLLAKKAEGCEFESRRPLFTRYLSVSQI
jgi:hypothetical protein